MNYFFSAFIWASLKQWYLPSWLLFHKCITSIPAYIRILKKIKNPHNILSAFTLSLISSLPVPRNITFWYARVPLLLFSVKALSLQEKKKVWVVSVGVSERLWSALLDAISSSFLDWLSIRICNSPKLFQWKVWPILLDFFKYKYLSHLFACRIQLLKWNIRYCKVFNVIKASNSHQYSS